MLTTTPNDRYTCRKCNCVTSGIIVEGKDPHTRWCVRCNSPLLHCNHCHHKTSGTQNGSEMHCDNCGKPVPATSLIQK